MPDTKRQSRQVSFINHDQIQTEVVAAVREMCTLQVTQWTQSLSWMFTKRDYWQEVEVIFCSVILHNKSIIRRFIQYEC